MPSPLTCPCCERLCSLEKLAAGRFHCERCEESIEKRLFPALIPTEIATTPALAQNSTCFYHPQKGAKSICQSCGVFVCALCETEVQEKVYCVRCLERGLSKEKETDFIKKAILYDGIALGLALLPLTVALFWVAPVTAPATLALVLFCRKKSKSILPPRRWRWILATLLAIGQISLMFWFLFK